MISEKDLRKVLLSVEKPGRYSGGEFGMTLKNDALLHSEMTLRVAVSYPDLYEIGMSNLAVRILYDTLNAVEGVSCERAFAPFFDFEDALRSRGLPLFSLETGTPLGEFDVIGFSVGYELCYTNILAMLELSGIPLCTADRNGSHPIIIAGGPAVNNPVPFGQVFDAVFIGEAEGVLPLLMADLALMKKRGASREDRIERILKEPAFWSSRKTERVRRAVYAGFETRKQVSRLVPNISVVQGHGISEIMRGCPNGCRFCHAGMYYRPFREKNISVIAEEVRELITEVGHREITLASLSSGDFSLLSELIASLNAQYKGSRVSFALPSLKIDSFTLPILRQLSEVRKSGLTFAVETPLSSCQIGLNKEASAEKTISIIREAKKLGWRSAKFYFMVGLPVAQDTDEVSDIIAYLEEVRIATNLSFNVNIGTFIPKPFTPFQWDRQLSESEALDRIMAIKRGLDKRFYKVGYHSPFTSIIEGLISRGGEEVTAVVMDAYRRGARLDAWEDHLKVDAWRDAFASAGWDVEKRVTSERPLDERLPWDSVSIGVSPSYLKRERQKAFLPELTSACDENCDHQCGSCGETRVKRNDKDSIPISAESDRGDTDLRYAKILFWYTKKGRATYLSHINVMNIFEGAFPRAGFRLKFSEGFNPKPKIEFAHPLSLGIFSEDEVASVILSGDFAMDEFISRINAVLPSGFMVVGAMPVRKEKERLSLMAMYWGSEYAVETADLEVEPAVFASRLEGKVHLSLRREEDRFLVRVQAGQGCESNIIRLCGEALDSEGAARELMIVRTRCLAKGDSGPVRYPEFFS